MVLEIGEIMNSVAIILVAVVSAKHTDKIKKISEGMVPNKEMQELNGRITDTDYKVKLMEEDLKNLRLEMIGKTERKPVPKEYFYKDFCTYVDFSDGDSIKESRLDYIAAIGIKAVISELPEEKRTSEVIDEIISRMEKQLKKQRIVCKGEEEKNKNEIPIFSI